MTNWFARQRQAWIIEMLEIYGFINRHHIVKKFGVSVPQASLDLKFLDGGHYAKYNFSTKRYERI